VTEEAPLNILYIDDDVALLRLAAKELGRRGMTVTAAADARRALKLIEREAFDAVVLDYYMPGSDGLDTLENIRARPNPPPVLYVTAAEDGRIAVAALKSGAADYVIKDVGEAFFDLLATSISQAVEQENLRRQKDDADAAMREERDRAEWLLREANHRCANSLQLVASFASMQATGIDDEAARQVLLETVNRINAVGQVHRRLYSTDDVRTVEMHAYLEGLVDGLGSAVNAEGRSHVIRLDADSLRLPTDRAVSLGVIVSELITNAVKYAYPDREGGEIRVALKQTSSEELELSVADDGVGAADEEVARGPGLGMRIIAAMSDALKGEIRRESGPGGRRVVVRLPARIPRASPEK
jgi:two-component sensor histidine kinase